MRNDVRFETEVLGLLSQLKAKKEKLQEQFNAELAAVEREIEAVSTTARLLRRSTEASAPMTAVSSLIPDLRGKTIKDGCIEIAKRNDGIVRVREAKEALISAGVLRHTKNSWGIVNTTLIRSKDFEKLPGALGSFRLVQGHPQGQLAVAQNIHVG